MPARAGQAEFTRSLFGGYLDQPSRQHPQYVVSAKLIIPYPVIMVFSQNQYIVVAPQQSSASRIYTYKICPPAVAGSGAANDPTAPN
jgi:hypothetical protein